MITNPSPSSEGQLEEGVSTDALLAEYLDVLRASPSFGTRTSAARHFMHWLRLRRILLGGIDAAVIEAFSRHRCRCPRFSPHEPRRPGYITNVRRFVSFLEDRGAILVPGDVDQVAAVLPAYAERLSTLGYSRGCRSALFSEAEHFAHWLRLVRIRACDVDAEAVDRFAHHNCQCFLCRKRGTLTASGAVRRRRGAMAFLDVLRGLGLAAPANLVAEDPRITAFRAWLKQRCGATDQSIIRYLAEAARWLPSLGLDPGAYDAVMIRQIVLDQPASRSRQSVRLTATALRAYLRFLATSGACRPELVHAVPCPPPRRGAALPRYLSPAAVERIVEACDVTTPMGLRDRAIVLLLARLGLRAGDVCQLKLADIDWTIGRLRVDGKSRRVAALPLPQDAGDALLAYIEQARPVVGEDRVFLRIQAPFRPFASPGEISRIVTMLRRSAGVEAGPSGAHVFRHSLATAMIRTGSSLETIGAVLRHRSPDTTAIYAKVDVTMLARVAQPWPGDASC
jgi:integrase